MACKGYDFPGLFASVGFSLESKIKWEEEFKGWCSERRPAGCRTGACAARRAAALPSSCSRRVLGSAVLWGAVALELGCPWRVLSSSEPRIPAGTGGRFPVWGQSESSRDNRSTGWPGAIGSLRGDERNTIFCLWPYYERLGLRNSCFSHIIALDKS